MDFNKLSKEELRNILNTAGYPIEFPDTALTRIAIRIYKKLERNGFEYSKLSYINSFR